MRFKDWFNEDEHDLFNFPEEAMEAAWNAALNSAAEKINPVSAASKVLRNKGRSKAACMARGSALGR